MGNIIFTEDWQDDGNCWLQEVALLIIGNPPVVTYLNTALCFQTESPFFPRPYYVQAPL